MSVSVEARAAPLEESRRPRFALPPVRGPRVPLLAIVTVSFLLLATWVVRHGAYPNGAWAPGSSDHYSHWSSTILFYHRGAEVYRKPLYLVCPPVAAEGVYTAVAAGDVCNIPEREGQRPLVTNWRQFPRPYPPGWLVWHAPAAFLYENTSISFHALNRLVVIQDLFAAHLAIFALAALLLVGPRRAHPAALAMRALVVALGASELIRWSMLGYYDVAAVACMLFGVIAIRDRRELAAAAWLTGALFLHYRAIWVAAPLLAWTALRVEERKRLLPLLIPLSLTAVALLLVWGSLRSFPLTNPVLHFRFDRKNPEHWNLAVPIAVALAVLVYSRAYLLLGIVAFHFYVIMRTPQVQPWHALSLLPLIAFAAIHGRRHAEEVAVTAIVLVECRQVFDVVPLPGAWLAALFAA
jgi:hypothetical protein